MGKGDRDVAVGETAASTPGAQPGPGASSAKPDELIGRTVGAYLMTEQLGAGAMGVVYRGVHRELGRPVAIKVLRPVVAADRSLVGRFFAEARAVNLIRHENIVECTDLISDDNGSYMVMELLEGQTLGQLIEASAALPWPRAVGIVAQIADAIGAAHDKGIVHRDLKPDNVYLIGRRESDDYVKVLDFGIAHLNPEMGGHSATQTGDTLGTPAYMSPEQVRGDKVSAATDIYGLGIILFEMITGRLPFEGRSAAEVMVSHLSDAAPEVSSIRRVPGRLSKLIARMLMKEPSDRPADMAEVALELRALSGPGLEKGTAGGQLEQRSTSEADVSAFSDTDQPPLTEPGDADGQTRRLRPIFAMTAIAVIGAGALGYALWSGRDDGEQDKQEALATPAARATLARELRIGGFGEAPAYCRPRLEAEVAALTSAARSLGGSQMGRARQRDRDAAAALAVAPIASAEGRAVHARALLVIGETESSLALAQKAAAACPKLALAHATVGAAQLLLREMTAAEAELKAAIELDGDMPDPRLNLALILLDAGRVDEAIRELVTLRERWPSLPNLTLALGEAFLVAKRYAEARDALVVAANEADDRGRAQLALGYAHRGLGEGPEASAAFCRAADLGESKAQALCPTPPGP